MITDTQAEKAADWIRDNADNIANAKGERVYAEKYRKSLKAIIFNEEDGSNAIRENKAYSDIRYLDHLSKLKEVVIEHEKLMAQKAAAEIKIEVWRTQAANTRGRL